MVAHHISDCYMYTYRACSEHNTKPIHVIPTEKYKKVSESIITTTVFIKKNNLLFLYLGAAKCIISTAQQARPNVIGHKEPWKQKKGY